MKRNYGSFLLIPPTTDLSPPLPTDFSDFERKVFGLLAEKFWAGLSKLHSVCPEKHNDDVSLNKLGFSIYFRVLSEKLLGFC